MRVITLLDLDDTILNTSSQIIKPCDDLWVCKIESILPTNSIKFFRDRLTLMRATSPNEVIKWIELQFPDRASEILYALDTIDQSQFVEQISVQKETVFALKRLREISYVAIVTQGDIAFQQRKIEILGLNDMSDECVICNVSNNESKLGAFKKFILRANNLTFVIGNRLDNEIAAGNLLGATTLQVKHGEGKYLFPRSAIDVPDYQVTSFPKAIDFICDAVGQL